MEEREKNINDCTDGQGYEQDLQTQETVYVDGACGQRAGDIPTPPRNAYVCYSDGSSSKGNPYVAARPYAAGNTKEKKKLNKTNVVLVSLVVVFFVACVTLGTMVAINLNAITATEDNGTVSETEKKDGDLDEGNNLSVPSVIGLAPIPEGGYDSLTELYKKCAPSCVSILCTVEYNNGFYVQEGQSLGSGFVVSGNDTETGDESYYIITNHHVIEGAKSITVRFYDNTDYEATLIGSDEMTDIAVLTIDKEDMVPLEIGDSDSLEVGQWVVAIGTPSDEELAGTMSYGIISGVNRELEFTNSYGTVIKTMTVIQTTATLNPGNSGGPLINMAGQVVGINALKLSEEYEGIGFALPSTSAMDIINSLITYGEVVDGVGSFAEASAQLGITGITVNKEIIEEYRLDENCPNGVLVVSMTRGTSVYRAGLSVDDIITKFNGKDISTMEELKAELASLKAGTTVELTFYRMARGGIEGQYHTISFKLDAAS